MIYRIVLKVSYQEAYFDFETSEDAAAFARVALTHMVNSEDVKRTPSITMLIIDPSIKEED